MTLSNFHQLWYLFAHWYAAHTGHKFWRFWKQTVIRTYNYAK